MFKRILVPLDGSRFGSRALQYATEVAQHFGAEVVLMQVVKPTTPVATTTGMAPGMESPATAELAAQAALEEDKRNSTRAKRYLSGKIRGMNPRDIKGVIPDGSRKPSPIHYEFCSEGAYRSRGYDYTWQERIKEGFHGQCCGCGNPRVRKTCSSRSATDKKVKSREKIINCLTQNT